MFGQGKPSYPEMVVLARVNANGVVELQQSGMLMLNNFMIGQILIACFQGFYVNGYKGLQYITGSKIKSKGTQNCLMISQLPQVDPKTQKNIFFAETTANNDVARQKLHILASLISSIVIIIANGNLNYLGSLSKRIVKPNTPKNNAGALNTASLFAVMPTNSKSNDFLKDVTQKIMEKLQTDNIYNEVKKSHQMIKGYQCSEQSLNQPTMPFKDKFLQELQMFSQYNRDNSQLMYGPILAKYLQNLSLQLNNNSNPMINVQTAEDDIIIDQGYQAYISGIRVYHQTTLNLVSRNSKPDDNQLQQMLDKGKSKAIQQFFAKGGSSRNDYRKMLQDYIFHKSREVNENYSKEQWNRNLQILQSESKLVLQKIKLNQNVDHNQISGYIHEMSESYNQNARGIQKYQVWNDYMKVFTPIAFEKDFAKQAKLKEQLKKNQELQRRLAQFQKKKTGGMCGSCSIM